MIPLKDENPTYIFPLVTIGIILLNCIFFLYQLSWGRGLVLRLGAIPYEITHGVDLPPSSPIPVRLTPFTSMFMHGGLLHIGGNMLYLWIFGDNVEEEIGHLRFLLFYFGCGLAAEGLQILTDPGSEIPMIGASGAIAGVLGGYLVRFPRARVLTLVIFGYFIRLMKVPAFLLLGLWFFIQLLNGIPGLGGRFGGGVAWFAHIGGFMAGVIGAKLLGKRR